MNGYTRTATPVPHQHRACAVRVSCRPCPWTMRHPHPQRTTYSSDGTTLEPKGGGKEVESSRVESRSAVTGWLTDCWRLWRYDAQRREMMCNSCVIIKFTPYVLDCCKHWSMRCCISCFIIAIIGHQGNITIPLNASSVGNATKDHFPSLASSTSAYHQWRASIK